MQFITSFPVSFNKNFVLDEEESFHLKKVLRGKIGDKIKVFDGEKRWLCEIAGFEKGRVILKPLKEFEKNNPSLRINLFFPFIERKSFEYVIKTSTEAGVFSITPIITEYTQRHFIFDINDKKERIYDIVKSAIKQSERDSFPIINNPENINNIFNEKESFFIMSYEKIHGRLFNVKDVINMAGDNINIVVGPEGGFSSNDLEFTERENIYPVKISDNVLRTETVSIFSVILFKSLRG